MPIYPNIAMTLKKPLNFSKPHGAGKYGTNGFTMTLAYNSGNTARKTACDILAANINALNPKFHVISAAQQWTSYSCTVVELNSYPFSSLAGSRTTPMLSDFIQPFMSTDGDFSGSQGYGDAATDALITQAATETDKAKRQADYDQLSTQFYNDCPGVMT